MSPKLKKILLIIAFISTAVLMALLIFWVFFSSRGPTGEQININGIIVNVGPGGLPIINGALPSNRNLNTNGTAVANTGLPQIDTIAGGGLTLTSEVTDNLTYFSTRSIDGGGLSYYNPEDGKFYRLSPDDLTAYAMSDQKFYSVNNVIWSPTKDKAILEYPDGSKIMYDFTNEKQYTLPSQYEDISFAPSGREISFKYVTDDEDQNWLAVANADGTGMQGVEFMHDETDKFAASYSPTGQIIGTFTESTSGETQEVYLIGKYGENFKSFKVDGKGFESQWSPNGQQLLYSAHSSKTDYMPSLWVVDASGESIGNNKINIGLNTTSDKCAFSGSSSVICAVPVGMERGSGPFPELSANLPDVFYRVDLNTGNKSQLAIPVDQTGGGQYQARDVFVDDNGEYMYFTDAYTGKVYKIRLR